MTVSSWNSPIKLYEVYKDPTLEWHQGWIRQTAFCPACSRLSYSGGGRKENRAGTGGSHPSQAPSIFHLALLVLLRPVYYLNTWTIFSCVMFDYFLCLVCLYFVRACVSCAILLTLNLQYIHLMLTLTSEKQRCSRLISLATKIRKSAFESWKPHKNDYYAGYTLTGCLAPLVILGSQYSNFIPN